jgi:hypothetical protein
MKIFVVSHPDVIRKSPLHRHRGRRYKPGPTIMSDTAAAHGS